MLAVSGLTTWRGNTCLFENLEFSLLAGTALLLRGPNGAGKTTLLRILCGLTRPESGQIRWDGRARPHGLRELAAYGGHQPGLSQDLSIDQNMRFHATICRWRKEWASVLDSLGLARYRDMEVRLLSAGQRRRAGLARVLMSDAAIWLLDEPFTNVDVSGRRMLEQRIADHLASGGMAVIAAHEEINIEGGTVEMLSLGMN